MTAVWVAIAAITLSTVAIKAAGPVVLGGRALAPWAARLIALLPAALLAALVVVQTFADTTPGSCSTPAPPGSPPRRSRWGCARTCWSPSARRG